MAGVAVMTLGGASIKPGETQHWQWNPAEFLAGSVWSFSLDVFSPKYQIIFAPYTMQMEITRVEYRRVFNSIGDQHPEIHVWVKNISTQWDALYQINMARAPVGGPVPV